MDFFSPLPLISRRWPPTTYHYILCTLNLLHQAHEQHIGTALDPVIVQLFFGLGSQGVVGAAQGAQQLRQRGLDVGR